MPVALGAAPDHDFDQPLGLLSDCHRRVEHFLDVLLRVVDDAQGGPLSQAHRDALETALAYFAVAAKRHTADEEVSLFPRMRRSHDPEVRAALARIDALEADHEKAAQAHAEVEHWCRRWLDNGPLAPPELRRLQGILRDLRATYAAHIAIEDHEVFPLAGKVLDARELAAVGQEMAQRRGLR